jgi:hypothetical protein
MIAVSERFNKLIELIDQLNSQDPNQELVEGLSRPRELVYSQRLTDWVLQLRPEASEALRIAARGQHIQRWTIPRDRYERNRQGYLRWRETLKAFHAEQVAALMRDAGYAKDMIERVSSLILKRNLSTDAEAQTLEDALCLLFLKTQFAELKQKTPDDKMKEIVQKTWKKMSKPAQAVVLQLPLGAAEKQWLAQVLRTSLVH